MPKRLKDLYFAKQQPHNWRAFITRSKFWFVLVLLLSLVFIPFGIYIDRHNSAIKKNEIHALEIAIQNKVNTFETMLSNMGGALNVVSQLPGIRAAINSQTEIAPDSITFLNELLLTFTRFEHIALINRTGKYRLFLKKELGQSIAVAPQKLGQLEDPAILSALQYGQENYAYVSSFYFEPSSLGGDLLQPSFYLSMPIFDKTGAFGGAIILKIALDLRYQRAAENAAPNSQFLHLDIFNGDWFVNELAPAKGLIGGSPATQTAVSVENPALWQAIQQHISGVFENEQGIYVYSSVIPFKLGNNELSWRFDPTHIDKYQYVFVNLLPWQNLHAKTPYLLQTLAAGMLFSSVLFVAFVVATRLEDSEFIKQKNQQLEDLYHLSDAIIDNLGAALIGIDQEGIITRFSHHAEILFGYEAEEVEGSNVKILMRADIAAKHDGFLSDYVKDTRAGLDKVRSILGKTRLLIAKAKDGTEFPVEIVVTKVPFGETFRFVGLITDISERIAMQEQISHALDRAQAATDQKTAFLAQISQDIRTPMDGIFGALQLVKYHPHPSAQDSIIEQSIFACKSMLSSMSNLLDIAKFEADSIDLACLPFNCLGLVDEIINDIKIPAKLKGVDIRLQGLEHFKDGWIGDPSRVKQILFNLAANAIKFTHKGHITITLGNSPHGHLVFVISDTGQGMTAEQLSKVFQPNGSYHNGIGLLISRDICQLMGGSLNIESAPQKGCSVTLELPLPPAHVSLEEDHSFTQVPDLSGRRMLLLDDNIVSQALLKGLVNDTHITVDIAFNQEEAIQKLAEQHYELAFIDAGNAHLDLAKCCCTIKAQCPLLPVVAIHCHFNANTSQDYKAMGFDEVLLPPCERRALFEMIHKYVDYTATRRGVV